MDPVSALGVAAAAVQFVDFSGSIVRSITDVYRVVESGASLQHLQQMKMDANRLQTLNMRLRRSLRPKQLGRQPNQTEDVILAVADQCIEIAAQLLRALDGFDPKNLDSKIEAIRIALRALWKKGKLESLNQRLIELREQLMLVVLLNLR